MRDVGGGGGGPFAYYPTTGSLIRASASAVERGRIGLGAMRSRLATEHRRALGSVDGDLYEPMAHAPQVATANLTRVEQAICFAAGVVRLFADAVDAYNHSSTNPRSVQALNMAYADARLDDPGGDGDETGEDRGPEAEVELRTKLTGLRAEYERLGEQLDNWADHAARMLARGPNPDDIRELWFGGALPSQAYELWPGLRLHQLTGARLPYDLRDGPDDTRALGDLTNDELLDLADNGNELARDIGGARVAHDAEQMTALSKFGLYQNPLYWKALAEGVPEGIARAMARASPHSFLELGAPIVISGQVTYAMTLRDLVNAFKDDLWSLRSAGELGMVVGPGKLNKLDNLPDALRSGRHLDETADWQDHSWLLRRAAREKGNFGLGSGTREHADVAGHAWVGSDYRLSKDGRALISSDGLRQYRPPSHKKGLGIWQANFEKRQSPHGPWQDNGHLRILDP